MTGRMMSNEKLIRPTPKTAYGMPSPADTESLPGKKRPVLILSLEIDENDDPGGDPYNHTGSFCLPKFKDE